MKREPNTERMRAWLPIIRAFGLDHRTVQHHPNLYPLKFAEQLNACADDDARALLLGVSK